MSKKRTTKKGTTVGGRPFDKATLYSLLRNPIVTGKITHKGEVHLGEHEAIVDQELFDQVQAQLSLNGRTGGPETRNKYGALLRGVLRCRTCDQSMTHTFCGGKKKHFYRYYRCVGAIKNGAETCSASTLPAEEIERLVIDEVRGLSTDTALLHQVLTEAQAAVETERSTLTAERCELQRAVGTNHRALRQLVEKRSPSREVTTRIAELNEQIASAERRMPILDARLAELDRETITGAEAEAAFSDFDVIWTNLSPREQARLLTLLVDRVEYDGEAGTVSVTFRPNGISALVTAQLEEAA